MIDLEPWDVIDEIVLVDAEAGEAELAADAAVVAILVPRGEQARFGERAPARRGTPRAGDPA